jgi:hypothetical protein
MKINATPNKRMSVWINEGHDAGIRIVRLDKARHYDGTPRRRRMVRKAIRSNKKRGDVQ